MVGFLSVPYLVLSQLRQRLLGLPACHPDTQRGPLQHPDGLCQSTALRSAPPRTLWIGQNIMLFKRLKTDQR